MRNENSLIQCSRQIVQVAECLCWISLSTEHEAAPDRCRAACRPESDSDALIPLDLRLCRLRARARIGSGCGLARPGETGLGLGSCNQSFSDSLLAGQFAAAADSFRFLASLSLRGLLVRLPRFHLAENSFALHLFLENSESLIDIVIAY